jgi:hypothetical protein
MKNLDIFQLPADADVIGVGADAVVIGVGADAVVIGVGADAVVNGVGVTVLPSLTFCTPSAMTRSPAVKPLVITHMVSTRSPV